MPNGPDIIGNRGERPPSPDEIERILDDMFKDVPYKQQAFLFQETVRGIWYQLTSNQIDEIKVLVETASRQVQVTCSDRHGWKTQHASFNTTITESLKEITRKASDWKINININIEEACRKARQADESDQFGIPEKQMPVKEPPQLYAAKMLPENSSVSSTSKRFPIKGYTLQEIQFEILNQTNPPDDTMMSPPDLWFPKQEHHITPSRRRWSLAEDGWNAEEEHIDSTQDPDLYFVDVDTHGEDGDCIVALLHYFSGDREHEKPISIMDRMFGMCHTG
ncbi:hypothetical protein CPB86DRAFT_13000 [Serendipita vermifera]|nr:hypothetical protein CPB86DRAFT_13000 [Serendipita vermifera]